MTDLRKDRLHARRIAAIRVEPFYPPAPPCGCGCGGYVTSRLQFYGVTIALGCKEVVYAACRRAFLI